MILDNSAKSYCIIFYFFFLNFQEYLICLKNFLSVYEKNPNQSDCLYFLGYMFENGLGVA